MTLQFADRFIKVPLGVAEDILVKVGSLIFPVDFVILDMKADPAMPILLGRAFLYTAKANFDMDGGNLTLQIGMDVVTFNMNDPGKFSSNIAKCEAISECYRVEVCDPEVAQELFRMKQEQYDEECGFGDLKLVAAVTFEDEKEEDAGDDEPSEMVEE